MPPNFYKEKSTKVDQYIFAVLGLKIQEIVQYLTTSSIQRLPFLALIWGVSLPFETYPCETVYLPLNGASPGNLSLVDPERNKL